MGTKTTIILDHDAVERGRLARLMTLDELRAAVGCSSVTIYFARHGRPVGLITARRLARALGIPLRALIVTDRQSETVQQAAQGAAVVGAA